MSDELKYKMVTVDENNEPLSRRDLINSCSKVMKARRQENGQLKQENEKLKYFKSEAIDRLVCTCKVDEGHICCNCLFIGEGHCKGETHSTQDSNP